MCGGAIISDFAPLVTKAKGRKLTAEELWSELDASAADDFWGFYSTSKLHPTNQGTYYSRSLHIIILGQMKRINYISGTDGKMKKKLFGFGNVIYYDYFN